MQAIEQGETLLNRFHHLESGSLVIAAGDSITTHYLLPYLEQFHAKYPEIKIEMANSYSTQMLDSVKAGKAELAFVNLPAEDDELFIKPCLEIHDVFVCSPEYQKKESYSWKEIAQLPLMMLEKNSVSRQYTDKKFQEKNIELKPQIEMAVHELLIRFASINLGVACVVEEFAKESLLSKSVSKIKLNPPLPSRNIGYAYLKHNPLSPAAKAFLEIIGNKNL